MEKFVYYGILFDIYQSLLKDSNKDIFKLYYEENLTLQEIADNMNVSKSYIGRIIKMTEKKLDDLESKLHIYEKRKELEKILNISMEDNVKRKIKELLDE